MNGSMREREGGCRPWMSALLVIGLTVVPMLVPVFATLRAADLTVADGALAGVGVDVRARAVGDTAVTRNDHDGDGIVDTADIDDDDDGVPDIREIAPDGSDRDSDGDGRPDRLDLDSDNDGIVDWREAGAAAVLNLDGLRVVGGRLVGDVGINGLIDVFESPVDTGRPAYTLADSDDGADDYPDILDLDSDNDGLPDLVEAGVAIALDGDRDGRIDAPPGSVGSDGIADHLQASNDRSCCDVTGDGVADDVPRDTDGQGTPDYRDLDSDDDGIHDLVELGGQDIDGDGRVDGFVDIARLGDGMDDGLQVFPLLASDVNGNGVEDHVDPFAPDPDGGAPPAPVIDDVAGSGDGLPGDAAIGDAGTGGSSGAGGGVRVGLDGSGCSIGTGSTDVVLILCALFGVAGIGRRLALRRGARR